MSLQSYHQTMNKDTRIENDRQKKKQKKNQRENSKRKSSPSIVSKIEREHFEAHSQAATKVSLHLPISIGLNVHNKYVYGFSIAITSS